MQLYIITHKAMNNKNTISRLSKSFALRIIKLYKFLLEEKHEYIMSKQVYRSGTSIGAKLQKAVTHRAMRIISTN